jgi:hypothetical protein
MVHPDSDAEYVRAVSDGQKIRFQLQPKRLRNWQPPERVYFSIHDYEALPRQRNAIRVLHLFPNADSSAVPLCELVVLKDDLQNQTRYEALSWCWGTKKSTAKIHIRTNRGFTDASRYITLVRKIQSNLADALKALRHSTKIRVLWIDALCINQDE